MLAFKWYPIASVQSLSSLRKITHMLGKLPLSTEEGMEGSSCSLCCNQQLILYVGGGGCHCPLLGDSKQLVSAFWNVWYFLLLWKHR
jgi:hypothetical protein